MPNTFINMTGYSHSSIDRAGALLSGRNPENNIRAESEQQRAILKVAEWRSSHSYPLNTFNTLLRSHVAGIPQANVVQRLKRMTTIIDKLVRERTMQVTQMQDIAGVRAILPTIVSMREVEQRLRSSFHNHKLHECYDYVLKPRPVDGYRSLHLVYKYRGRHERAKQYNDLRIEVQLRTKVQHAWATSVEAIGAIIGQDLKSKRADKQWIQFFALVSNAFAILESTPRIPGLEHYKQWELGAEINRLEAKLKVLDKFQTYGHAMREIDTHRGFGQRKSGYFLLSRDTEMKTITITAFASNQVRLASEKLSSLEQEIISSPSKDVVLVSASSHQALKKAYPNYFLDMDLFISYYNAIIHSGRYQSVK